MNRSTAAIAIKKSAVECLLSCVPSVGSFSKLCLKPRLRTAKWNRRQHRRPRAKGQSGLAPLSVKLSLPAHSQAGQAPIAQLCKFIIAITIRLRMGLLTESVSTNRTTKKQSKRHAKTQGLSLTKGNGPKLGVQTGAQLENRCGLSESLTQQVPCEHKISNHGFSDPRPITTRLIAQAPSELGDER